ncbi:MAG: ATP-binding protein [Jaaginema sp. PMC 1079.18]|nr:ATP-binding protein [Jaaginema sp. PMC 1080.18]MEC4850104.1 ATP-binding protein [Jaaginema sp. PMC 1079.18]MEC4864808.1 ATP-binding protein [Jaaginema sp. PMC 1078.18]
MKYTTAITSNIAHLIEAHEHIQKARKEKMLLIYGNPGMGKTQACELLETEGAILWEAPARCTGYHLVRSLLDRLGSPGCRSFGAGLDQCIKKLSESNQTLIVDEAGRLLWRERDQLIEVLRYIHDAADVPLIFTGMPDIYNYLSPYPQVCDRIFFVEFLPWSYEDTRLVMETCCEVKVKADLLKRLYSFAKGNGRLTSRALEHIERHAKALGIPEIGGVEWGNQPFLPAISQQPESRKGKRRRAA